MDSKLAGPVAEALADLSETDQQILAMLFVEELNSTEIAGQLGLKPSTVRMRKKTLLRTLAGNAALRDLAEPQLDELEDIFEDAATYTLDLQDL